MKSKFLADLEQITGEISDLLQKSKDKMEKADDEKPEEKASPDAAAEPEAPAPEAPAEGAESEAGEQAQDPDASLGEDDGMTIEQHAEKMSDEELHSFIEVLMAELEKRHGAETAPDAGQAPEAPAAPGMDAMQKSIEALSATVEKLAAKIDSTEVLAKSKIPKLVVKGPAPAVNKGEALEKSKKEPQRLTKSETAQFLLGLQREGSRLVSSDDVARLSLTDDSSIPAFQDSLTKRGVKFPTL